MEPSDDTQRAHILRTVTEQAVRAFWAVQALHDHRDIEHLLAVLRARAQYHGLTEELVRLTGGRDILAVLSHAPTEEEPLDVTRLLQLRTELGIRVVELGELPSELDEAWWDDFLRLVRSPGTPGAGHIARKLAPSLPNPWATEVLVRADYYATNIIPDWLRLLRRVGVEVTDLDYVPNDWLPRI